MIHRGSHEVITIGTVGEQGQVYFHQQGVIPA